MTAVLPAGSAGAPIPQDAPSWPTFPTPTDPRTGPWLFGLALALATDGIPDDHAAQELLDEAHGSVRSLEAAYGRGVVALSEYPSDPMLRRALDLVSKALRRGHRHAPADGYA